MSSNQRTLDFTGVPASIVVAETGTISFPFRLYDATGALVDLTGRTFASHIRNASTPPPGPPLVAFSTSYDPPTRTVTFAAAAPAIGQYDWDLWETTAGRRRQYAAGTVFVRERVTVA